MTHKITMIVPYYNQPKMLDIQLREWETYPTFVHDALKIIVVDDCSQDMAVDYFYGSDNAELYRITTDIPWNRGGARNLGSKLATTNWLLHIDIDHVLRFGYVTNLVNWINEADDRHWYRFKRYRFGKADETRKKDAISPSEEFGEIKPHIDSYLCRRTTYWDVGGYDEDYSGCLGGGSPFIYQLGQMAKLEILKNVALTVYTRDKCEDASVLTLNRDTAEYTARKAKKQREGNTRAKNPIRFKWERQL